MSLFSTYTHTLLLRLREAYSQSTSRLGRITLRSVQVALALMGDLISGLLTLRAMSLVYTTLLSIAPFIALSFSLLKAMGAHQKAEPWISELLVPLGDQGVLLGQQLVGFVDNMNLAVLGWIGLLTLIWTVVSMVQKIESAFNFIWRVNELRPISQRFTNYLSSIMIIPLLLSSALGLTASAKSSSLIVYLSQFEVMVAVLTTAGKFVPTLLYTILFTFLYIFIPNTKIKILPAIAGALVATLLWQLTGSIFANFVAASTQYTAIYSSFAIFILLLIWLNIIWLIVLTGSCIAFYVQNPEEIYASRQYGQLSIIDKEHLMLLILLNLAKRQYLNQPQANVEDLVNAIDIPSHYINETLSALIDIKLIKFTNEAPMQLTLCSDSDQLMVSDLLRTYRNYANPGQILSLDSDEAKKIMALIAHSNIQVASSAPNSTSSEAEHTAQTNVSLRDLF